MRPKTLLILFVLVVALGGFIWLFERELPSSDERRELEKRVLGVEAAEVSSVELEFDGQTVRLERQPGDGEDGEPTGEWLLVEPPLGRADGLAADGLVNDLAGLEKVRTLEDADPAQLGLEEPRGEVVLTTGDGEVRLMIGAEIPAAGDMIVALAGDGVPHVVAAGVWDDISKPAGEWRSLDVFVAAADDVERLTLAAGESRIDVARRGEVYWLESPFVDRAEQGRVEALLDSLTGLRVDSFVDDPPEDLAELGLEPPEAVFELLLADGSEPLRLEVGATGVTEELRFARAEGRLLLIDDSLDDALSRSPAEWQSTAWTGYEVWEMDRLTIDDGEEQLVLERDGGEWRRDGERIASSVASDLLYSLTGAKAERLVDRSEVERLGAKPDAPELRLRVESDGGSEDLVLLAATAEGVPAGSGERAFYALLEAADVEELESRIQELRAAEPLAEEGEESEG